MGGWALCFPHYSECILSDLGTLPRFASLPAIFLFLQMAMPIGIRSAGRPRNIYVFIVILQKEMKCAASSGILMVSLISLGLSEAFFLGGGGGGGGCGCGGPSLPSFQLPSLPSPCGGGCGASASCCPPPAPACGGKLFRWHCDILFA